MSQCRSSLGFLNSVYRMFGLIALLVGSHFAQLNETSAREIGAEIVSGLQEVVGEYEGEVRMQSSDGKVDRPIIKQAQLHLDIQGNELVLKSSTDLLGKGCKSKVGSIQELMKFAPYQPQILRAIFSFDVNKCKRKQNWDSLAVFLMREGDHSYTLETLLLNKSMHLETTGLRSQNLNIHGFFTKKKMNLSALTREAN